MRIDCSMHRNMGFHKKMAAVLVTIWAQFAYTVHSSNDCTVVSVVLESCYLSLQSGTFFMNDDNLCCKSLHNLENRTQEHKLTRYAVCECFKAASDNDNQVFVNQNLLEVQTLCGPHVPRLITGYSDCLQYAHEGSNGRAAL